MSVFTTRSEVRVPPSIVNDEQSEGTPLFAILGSLTCGSDMHSDLHVLSWGFHSFLLKMTSLSYILKILSPLQQSVKRLDLVALMLLRRFSFTLKSIAPPYLTNWAQKSES
ncbi:hypothetical protein ACFE04_012859 [Oxalis oulophora]